MNGEEIRREILRLARPSDALARTDKDTCLKLSWCLQTYMRERTEQLVTADDTDNLLYCLGSDGWSSRLSNRVVDQSLTFVVNRRGKLRSEFLLIRALFKTLY